MEVGILVVRFNIFLKRRIFQVLASRGLSPEVPGEGPSEGKQRMSGSHQMLRINQEEKNCFGWNLVFKIVSFVLK